MTNRNRQLGKFHGGLPWAAAQATASTARAARARLVEGGVEALETWCPGLLVVGGGDDATQDARASGDRTAEPAAEGHAATQAALRPGGVRPDVRQRRARA